MYSVGGQFIKVLKALSVGKIFIFFYLNLDETRLKHFICLVWLGFVTGRKLFIDKFVRHQFKFIIEIVFS